MNFIYSSIQDDNVVVVHIYIILSLNLILTFHTSVYSACMIGVIWNECMVVRKVRICGMHENINKYSWSITHQLCTQKHTVSFASLDLFGFTNKEATEYTQPTTKQRKNKHATFNSAFKSRCVQR